MNYKDTRILKDTGNRIQDTGYMTQDTRYRIQDTGYRIQDTRYKIPRIKNVLDVRFIKITFRAV